MKVFGNCNEWDDRVEWGDRVGVDEGVGLGFERHHLAAFSLLLYCIRAEVLGFLSLDVGVMRAI
jgi:hypothetical protein